MERARTLTLATTVPNTGENPAGENMLNQKTRLSESSIWKTLEDVYRGGGKALWEKIPYYVTSSTFIAEHYAELIVSFLLEYYDRLNKAEPIYIIEMGTGTGCFSFYVMKELAAKRKYFSKLAGLKLKYVMCDFSENTIAGWLDSDELVQFRKDKTLDFAVFKPQDDTQIITYDKVRIAADTVKNPIIALANYFFDSLRQDAFRVNNHKLEEVLHSFALDETNPEAEESPFNCMVKTEEYVPVSTDYYDDDELNAVLKRYEKELDEATVVFPLGAFNCLRNLRQMSNNQVVLISTDKGFTQPSFMQGLWEQPFCAHHGIFSYAVNYDAIAKYFEYLGGFNFATDIPSFSVETQMSVLLPNFRASDMEMTKYHFLDDLAKKNSINYLYYCQNLLVNPGSCSKNDMLKAYIGFIRSSNCDPIALYLCADYICDALGDASVELRRTLKDTLADVEENFFHVRQRTDVLYYLGKIRYLLDDFDGCLRLMRRSINTFGENSHSIYYVAACNEVKHNYQIALDHYTRSLAMEPNCEVAQRAIGRCYMKLQEPAQAVS